MLSDVLNRPWFSRVWTVQEVALPQVATIICGEAHIAWGYFVSALDLLAVLEQRSGSTVQNVIYYLNQRTAIHRGLRAQIQSHYREIRQALSASLRPYAGHAGSDQVKLSGIFGATLRLRCSQPRDKLYGLYGLLVALGAENVPQVDDRKTVRQVFTDASRLILDNDRSLDLLRHQGGTRPTSSLPSWVLDLNGDAPPFTSSTGCTAAGTSNPDFRILGAAILLVRGKLVDRVERRAVNRLSRETDLFLRLEARTGVRMSEQLQQGVQRVEAVHEWAQIALGPLYRYCANHERAIQAFRETVTQGGVLENNPNQTLAEDILESFSEWLDYLCTYTADTERNRNEQALRRIEEIVADVRQQPSIRNAWLSNDPSCDVPESILFGNSAWRIITAWSWSRTRRLHFHIYRLTMGHTFFITQAGYMGLATDRIKDGDHVVLIAGFKSPMVIRAIAGGKYSVIGPAYIEGLMKGELWVAENVGRFEFE